MTRGDELFSSLSRCNCGLEDDGTWGNGIFSSPSCSNSPFLGELLDFLPLLFGIFRIGLLSFNTLVAGEAWEFCSTT